MVCPRASRSCSVWHILSLAHAPLGELWPLCRALQGSLPVDQERDGWPLPPRRAMLIPCARMGDIGCAASPTRSTHDQNPHNSLFWCSCSSAIAAAQYSTGTATYTKAPVSEFEAAEPRTLLSRRPRLLHLLVHLILELLEVLGEEASELPGLLVVGVFVVPGLARVE